MSLEAILGSETEIQILRTLRKGNYSYSAEELESETTKNISVIYKALRSLSKENIIRQVEPGSKTRYYRLNVKHRLGEVIKDLFEAEVRNYGLTDTPTFVINVLFSIKQKLKAEIRQLDKIMVFGSAIRQDFTPQSDIDLYLVVDKEDIVRDKGQIQTIINKYREKLDLDFSVIVRSKTEYREEFSRPTSKLAASILKDGWATIYGKREEDERMENNFRE